MKFDSVDQILDFAIQKEQEASDFYTDLAAKKGLPVWINPCFWESNFKGIIFDG